MNNVALIFFTNSQQRSLKLEKAELLVAIPTFFITWKTKSLGGTVIGGMLLYWLAGFF